MYVSFFFCLFFFFKQKTAYEMRISDWSSDVCSSDLNRVHASCPCADRPHCDDTDGSARRRSGRPRFRPRGLGDRRRHVPAGKRRAEQERGDRCPGNTSRPEIGTASCRDRVCQCVLICVVAFDLKKKTLKNQQRSAESPYVQYKSIVSNQTW